MRAALALALLVLIAARPALAEGERAGAFDYYVLAMSWSPNWCALEGDARDSPQCRDGSGLGWVLHGLWPQYERGWPSRCASAERPPTRGMTEAMADIMGTSGLAWHQWSKHGVCSGLSAEGYYALSRRAFEAVNRPELLRRLERAVTLPASVIEEAFLEVNPGWAPDMLTITCRSGHIQEARLCLTQDLEPRSCGRDIVRDCAMRDARLEPMR